MQTNCRTRLRLTCVAISHSRTPYENTCASPHKRVEAALENIKHCKKGHLSSKLTDSHLLWLSIVRLTAPLELSCNNTCAFTQKCQLTSLVEATAQLRICLLTAVGGSFHCHWQLQRNQGLTRQRCHKLICSQDGCSPAWLQLALPSSPCKFQQRQCSECKHKVRIRCSCMQMSGSSKFAALFCCINMHPDQEKSLPASAILAWPCLLSKMLADLQVSMHKLSSPVMAI